MKNSYPNIREYLLAKSSEIVQRVDDAGRSMTAGEKSQVEQLLREIEEIDANEAFKRGDVSKMKAGDLASMSKAARERQALMNQVNAARGPVQAGPDGGFGLGGAVHGAGFDLKSRPTVEMSAVAALGVKTTTNPSADFWNPVAPEIRELGQDGRFLFRHLATVDATGRSAVEDFTQTSRSVSGTVKRAIDATSTKAEVAVTLTHVVEQIAQFAVVTSSIPNAILESIANMNAFLDSEMTYEVNLAIDAHVIAQIMAGVAGSLGTSDIIFDIRTAVSDMRALGANPTLLALDPATAADLDLATSGDNTPYLFPTRDSGNASPLFGLTIVESPAMIGKSPLLIDPILLGAMYLGGMRFDANPYSEFSKNLTTLRCEVNGLFHVRQFDGAWAIGGS